MKAHDSDYLQQALTAASVYRGFCAPNPAVGAVVVKEGHVLSTGNHQGPGHPHAEVNALKGLGEAAKGATLYVTLEPCCHTGRTPPCTDLIIQSGIQKVIYGFRDPNPLVSAHSEKILQKAGITCQHIHSDAINHFYESYAWWWKYQLPWVTAKLAISLDGKIAGAGGLRIQLTGEQVQHFTHERRKRADAILTTAQTILADNPLLNVRLPSETLAKPVYIIDRQKRITLPSQAKVFQTASRVKLLHGKRLIDNLKEIGSDGVQDIWVEAGGTLFSCLIQQKLVQRAFIYIAPKTIGKKGLAWITENNLFEDTKSVQWKSCGQDVIGEILWV